MGMGGGSLRETRWGGGAFARGKSFERSEKGGGAERRGCIYLTQVLNKVFLKFLIDNIFFPDL